MEEATERQKKRKKKPNRALLKLNQAHQIANLRKMRSHRLWLKDKGKPEDKMITEDKLRNKLPAQEAAVALPMMNENRSHVYF